tara:strand:+ start:493 stop:726 length:234 start_codon:yes stop_codon:yes gene_type:complete
MPDALQPDQAKRVLYRIAEAASLLAVTGQHVRNLVKLGDLEGFTLHNGVSHVSAASLRAFLRRRRAPGVKQPESISL